ncbi:MAG: DUF1801 domain-containing protein [Candidatus Micrarchaeota archaeon]|nr:DUF1801 domain-containing protein [Candidatus Micrarchaeota archaeon]
MVRASKEVDAYIARCPKKVRGRLRELRSTIRETVPDATELISYSMPGYCYKGYSYKGMFAWFGLQSSHIGLYLRPPTLWDHRRELSKYKTTKSALHLPLDKPVPKRLVRQLVRYSAKVMKKGS